MAWRPPPTLLEVVSTILSTARRGGRSRRGWIGAHPPRKKEGVSGPWKCRDFDPVAWRPPDLYAEAQPSDPASQYAHDNLVGIVIGYVVFRGRALGADGDSGD
jgi:hypothetical protein